MIQRILWQKPKLHENNGEHRKVSWLELFFDLIFVVVISELVHLLSLNLSLPMLVNYLFLFIPAWWIWIGATYYNDRFETEGLESRLFTFLLMLPVAGLAIFAHHLPHDSALGYGMCYTLARLCIVLMWARAAYYEKRSRPVAKVLISGYCFSILLFLGSVWADTSVRFALWTVALGCDICTPLLTLKRQAKLPRFSVSKLPERLGLFVIIVIGETLVGVIRGIARHHHFSFKIFSEGIVGVAISFALWWIYFDDIAQRPPRSQHRATFLWSYLHLIVVMSIGVVGASILHVLTSKHHLPTDSARILLASALAISLIFMGLIETVLEREEGESGDLRISWGLKWLAAVGILSLGLFGHQLHTLLLLLLIFGFLLAPMGYGVFVGVSRKRELQQSGQ